MLKVFITGRPGIGKTTVFMKVVANLRNHGYTVGGIICPEIRSGGRRLGFNIVDLFTGEEGILARICRERESGPRVGKYCVNVNDAVAIGVNAIKKALMHADVVGVDEVGPMELKVPQLKSSIYEAIQSRKPVLAVVHHRIIGELASISNARVYEVNYSNRDTLPKVLLTIILDFLKKR
mgnify:CR=1 FL=1